MKKLFAVMLFLIIPFTCQSATKTFGGTNGNWSDNTKWEEGSKPADGDDVVFDDSSGTCTIDEDTASLRSLYMPLIPLSKYLLGSEAYTLTIAPQSGTVESIFWKTIFLNSNVVLSPASGATLELNLYTVNELLGAKSVTMNGPGTIKFTTGMTSSPECNFTINGPITVTFNSGDPYIFGHFTALGTPGNVITLNTSTPGSAVTFTKTWGGTIQCNYLDITDINVSPSNTWFYGNQSTYNSGTGWGVIAPNFIPLLN